MMEPVMEENSDKNKSQRRCNLRKIGEYWFLEAGGKLKRLMFLNDAHNVRMEDNVIFTDASVYQVQVESDNTVQIIKVEDVYEGFDEVTSVDYGEASVKEEQRANILRESDVDSHLTAELMSGAGSVICESEYPDCSDENLEMGQKEYGSGEEDSDKVEQLEMGSEEFVTAKNMSKPVTVKALFDFEAHIDDEITFKKADTLIVEEEELSESHIWINASHQSSRQTGFIPRNFVAKDDNSPQSQDWWHKINKEESDELLSCPSYKHGTFLIRDSSDKSSLVLSVKTVNPDAKTSQTTHYRIICSESGGFYINKGMCFTSMSDLISFYRKSASGLCCKLEDLCPKEIPDVPLRDLEISRKSVVILKKLFGHVYMGYWRGRQVAVHSTNSEQTNTKTNMAGLSYNRDRFMTEINILKHLRHERVVDLFAVHTEMEPFLMITELPKAPLSHFLKADGGKSLELKNLTDMAGQIVNGMVYLERMGVLHMDLRADNILLGHENQVKIGGFALAKWLQNGVFNASENDLFALKWTAPEAAFGRTFNTKSDVWSFGVLLYEIFTFGNIPYPGIPGKKVLSMVHKGYRMKRPESCPKPYYEIMLTCWASVPDIRPSFSYLSLILFIKSFPPAKDDNVPPAKDGVDAKRRCVCM